MPLEPGQFNILRDMEGFAGERFRAGLPISQRGLMNDARRAGHTFSNEAGRALAGSAIDRLNAIFEGASAELRFRPPPGAVVAADERLRSRYVNRVLARGTTADGRPFEQVVSVATDQLRSVQFIIAEAESILGQTLQQQGVQVGDIDSVEYIGTLERQ